MFVQQSKVTAFVQTEIEGVLGSGLLQRFDSTRSEAVQDILVHLPREPW
jgi:hypothetical protein